MARAVMAGWVAAVVLSTIGSAQTGRAVMPPLALDSLTGRDSFDRYCASCHGPDGRGSGPVAAALKTRPADLTTLAERNGGVFPAERLRQLIEGRGPAAHGDRTMPVWGVVFKRQGNATEDTAGARIDALVAYLQSIQ